MSKINPKKTKVAVAMSGGVDSSVAAYLLKKQGFDVHGFFMKNWSPLTDIENDCPWQEDYEDVRKVCQHLRIPYSTINLEKEYKEKVLSYFLTEYQKGRTPNPDVMCNKEIKFDIFLDKVSALGFDYMATGHYCKKSEIRNPKSEKNNVLVKPKDEEKDQTYFLCHLTSEQLGKVMFPLADLTKDEVRQIAKKAGLPNARKKDSQGICFIGKLPVREFLKSNLDIKPGKVVDTNGNILGEHEGAQLYTVGQRRVGIAGGDALYVTKTEAASNMVVMGEEKDLYTDELEFEKSNWLVELPDEFECRVQIRYRTRPVAASVKKSGEVKLHKSVRAITPGQFVAFYNDEKLIGGAVIK